MLVSDVAAAVTACGEAARAGARSLSAAPDQAIDAALRRMAERIDPSTINAAPFLGLNGIVVKTHGGADARGFATAIRVASDLARSDFVAQIDRNLRTMTASMPRTAVEAGERTKA